VTELADAFAWWEDKQVAVRVNGKVVRGWVRSARHTADRSPAGPANRSGVTDTFAGQMSIVLMLDSAAEAALFPSEIHVGIADDGRHGRPVGVARVWPEYGEEGTVRPRPAAGHLAVQRRFTHAAQRRTPASR
jgi:hypothetical protein